MCRRLDWAFAERGETYRLLKRHDEALADFDQALALHPEDAWAWGSRGQTYRELGRHSDALADLTRAIDLDPTMAWALVERGEIHQLLGHRRQATADLNRAVGLDWQPDTPATRGKTQSARAAARPSDRRPNPGHRPPTRR